MLECLYKSVHMHVCVSIYVCANICICTYTVHCRVYVHIRHTVYKHTIYMYTHEIVRRTPYDAYDGIRVYTIYYWTNVSLCLVLTFQSLGSRMISLWIMQRRICRHRTSKVSWHWRSSSLWDWPCFADILGCVMQTCYVKWIVYVMRIRYVVWIWYVVLIWYVVWMVYVLWIWYVVWIWYICNRMEISYVIEKKLCNVNKLCNLNELCNGNKLSNLINYNGNVKWMRSWNVM